MIPAPAALNTKNITKYHKYHKTWGKNSSRCSPVPGYGPMVLVSPKHATATDKEKNIWKQASTPLHQEECTFNYIRALHGVGAVLLKWGWESLLSPILSTYHCLLCQKYIWQQSLEHKEQEKPMVDHLYPLYLCVITPSFLLVYLSIWAGIHGKGAGINLQWAKKILILYLNYRYICNISTLL